MQNKAIKTHEKDRLREEEEILIFGFTPKRGEVYQGRPRAGLMGFIVFVIGAFEQSGSIR